MCYLAKARAGRTAALRAIALNPRNLFAIPGAAPRRARPL